MKPESFDLPYGPISSAFRVLAIPVAVAAVVGLAGFGAWQVANNPRREFPIEVSEISNWTTRYADSVYIARGVAGPYQEGPTLTGAVGGGIHFQVKDQSVECPAVPGSNYHAASFINKDDKAYIVVLLLKDTGVIAQAKE